MSSSAALLQFAAEFVLFLASAAGVGSLLVARDTGGGRPLLRLLGAAGFVALAVSAVVRGSDLAGESDTVQVVGLRATGVVLLALQAVRAPLGRPARVALWLGLVLLVAAGATDIADEAIPTGVLLAAGGALLGLSVVLAGQRSIATRVSTSAGGTLLVVVLVLGVALSAVLLDTVQDGVVERLERRAGNEAANAQASATQLAGAARVVAGSLGGGPLRDGVVRLADRQVASDALNEPLITLSGNFLEDASLAFVSRRGAAQGAVNLTATEVVGISGSEVVREALASGDARNAVEVVAGSALAIRVQPVPIGGPPPLLGVAVAAVPLDRTYLERAARDDRDLSLALVTPDRVLSSFGPGVPPEQIDAMVARAIETGTIESGTVAGRFVSVAPVDRGDGSSSVALVASYPTALVADTRDELFQVLFLIALAGTLIALTLASLVGARIGARLRRLTEAARSIRRGEPVPPTGVSGDDEVGVLSSAFDAMARSVADKTAAEVGLRGRLEAVVAGMAEALVAVDGAGLVTEFNPAAEALLRRPAADAAGRPLDELVHLTDADGRSLAGELRASGGWAGRAWVEVAGARVPVAVSVGVLDGATGTAGSVVTLRDLRAEEQLEKVKDQILSRFSHEFRQPLTPILAYGAKLARKPADPERVQEWGGIIVTEGGALLRIVEILEFFSQVAADRLNPAREWVEPADLVEDVVKRWRPRLAPPWSLRRSVARRLPPLYVDRVLVGRCLDELIDNARKFSPDGGDVVVGAENAGDGRVALWVGDSGIGMTPEEQVVAFTPFGQGDPSDTRRYGGLGLGLPFVQEVVAAHRGEVRCQSAPGSGSKLSLLLPSLPKDGQR